MSLKIIQKKRLRNGSASVIRWILAISFDLTGITILTHGSGHRSAPAPETEARRITGQNFLTRYAAGVKKSELMNPFLPKSS